ncbi:MAG: ABC transporter permease [Oscillospiraceae bacterium]|nr:ABC transporter permease [Oscillospiraceae bacterium]
MKAKGWQQVFKFTFLQMIKSKSYIISTIIIIACILLMSLGANFLPGLLMGRDNDKEPTLEEVGVISPFRIDTIYLSDRSSIEPAPYYGFLTAYNIDVVMISESEVEAITEKVRTSLEAIGLIEVIAAEYGYDVIISRPEFDGLLSTANFNTISEMLNNRVWRAHMISIGVPEDSIDDISIYVNSQITIAGETPRNEMATMLANSIIPMVSSMVLFMFIFMYGSLTAQAIATEKTSRVMETLLTSVRPMAVILGKVLGMGLASFTQFFALVVAGFGISAIVAPFGTLGQVFGSVEIAVDDVQMHMVKTAFDEAFSGFNPLSLIWIIVIFLLGFFFYSLIGGLFGATISRIEDLQSALTPMSLIGVFGFYLAYVSPAFSIDSEEVNIVQRFSYYFPISSPFALPGVIISGEMNAVGALISVGFLAVCCVLMLMFVSRIYETIITHTGNRITLKAMFKMAKGK